MYRDSFWDYLIDGFDEFMYNSLRIESITNTQYVETKHEVDVHLRNYPNLDKILNEQKPCELTFRDSEVLIEVLDDLLQLKGLEHEIMFKAGMRAMFKLLVFLGIFKDSYD